MPSADTARPWTLPLCALTDQAMASCGSSAVVSLARSSDDQLATGRREGDRLASAVTAAFSTAPSSGVNVPRSSAGAQIAHVDARVVVVEQDDHAGPAVGERRSERATVHRPSCRDRARSRRLPCRPPGSPPLVPAGGWRPTTSRCTGPAPSISAVVPVSSRRSTTSHRPSGVAVPLPTSTTWLSHVLVDAGDGAQVRADRRHRAVALLEVGRRPAWSCRRTSTRWIAARSGAVRVDHCVRPVGGDGERADEASCRRGSCRARRDPAAADPTCAPAPVRPTPSRSGVGGEGQPDRLVGRAGEDDLLGEVLGVVDADEVVAAADGQQRAVGAELQLPGAGHVQGGPRRAVGEVEDVEPPAGQRVDGDEPGRADGHRVVADVRTMEAARLDDRAVRLEVVHHQLRRVARRRPGASSCPGRSGSRGPVRR